MEVRVNTAGKATVETVVVLEVSLHLKGSALTKLRGAVIRVVPPHKHPALRETCTETWKTASESVKSVWRRGNGILLEAAHACTF